MKLQQIGFLVLFCFSMSGYAQFGNGMGGRNNSRLNQPQNDIPASKPEEKSADEIVSEMMPELTTEINLDALQQVAVKQILVESLKRKGIVMKKEDNQEAKFKELQDITENTNKDIEAILNSNQKESFKRYKEDKSDPKQAKKARKKAKKNKNK